MRCIITSGVFLGAITDSNRTNFAECLPRHMIDFGRAHCAALLARDEVSAGGFMGIGKACGEEGILGLANEPDKTLDQIADDYLHRNPLYPSLFRASTPEAQQFAEHLRSSGCGEYDLKLINRVPLNAFILWADEKPEEVKCLLNLMWQAIQPEEDILKIDPLHNAIFTCCMTVFAVIPDALVDGFLS